MPASLHGHPTSVASTAVALLALAACQGPPARLIVGFADTVVVNHLRPVRVPVQVRDAAGHVLPDTGVRFHWTSGVPVPVSPGGVVTCTQAGDALLRASVGPLARSALLRCRPVREVRGGGMLNVVLGDPPSELSFQPVDSAGRPVTPFTAHATVQDSTILALDGWRIRARASGATGVDVTIGDRSAFWSVHVYRRALTLDGIAPGQRLAVPVRLAAGEMRTWRLPASPRNYFVAMLPGPGARQTPWLHIDGARCDRMAVENAYDCLARRGAALIAYHPRQADPAGEWTGTLAVFLREQP